MGVRLPCYALPAPGLMVCTRNWGLGGLPAQPRPLWATNIDAVESGGETRNPLGGVGLHAEGSNTPMSVSEMTAEATWPGCSVIWAPFAPSRCAGAPTW